jgi:hypothetical protein
MDCERATKMVDSLAGKAEAGPATSAGGEAVEEAAALSAAAQRPAVRVAEVAPEQVPAAVQIVEMQVDEYAENGRFADAMEFIEATLKTSPPEERKALEKVRSKLVVRADKAFSDLVSRAREDAAAGRLRDAEGALNLARGRFGFEPYSKRIDRELKSVRKIAGEAERPASSKGPVLAAGPGGTPPGSAADAVKRTVDEVIALIEQTRFGEARRRLEDLRRDYGHTEGYKTRQEELNALLDLVKDAPMVDAGTVPEPAQPGPTPVAGEEPTATAPVEPEPAAPAGDTEDAKQYLAELGWLAEGGTWTLKSRGTVNVVSQARPRALLRYKTNPVMNLAAQFDARVITGSGFRLQFRWQANRRPRYYGSNQPGCGYAVHVAPVEYRLLSRGATYGFGWYYSRSSRDSDDYRIIIRRKTRGQTWLRYGVQMMGPSITATVSGQPPMTRKEEDFQTGELRFEFLSGEVELRNLKAKCR